MERTSRLAYPPLGSPTDAADEAPPLREAGPLFLGLGLLVLGLGLVHSLLGVRAALEGFSTTMIGLVMSAYYLGYLVGSVWIPGIVRDVGHIRAFAALASTASVAFLLHGVFVDVLSWAAMRLVGGFCIAGTFVVVESWLNGLATNTTRGRLLAVYMLVMFGAFGGGQLLLAVDDPAQIALFVLASVLVSMAVVPITISQHQPPSLGEALPISLHELSSTAPLGVVTALLSGAAHASLQTMGAVFAHALGFRLSRVALLMTAILVGALVLQVPTGHLSDRVDRRRLMAVFSACATGVAAVALLFFLEPAQRLPLIALAGALGAATFPLYPLAIAHLNDRLESQHVVAASGKLVLLYSIGAILGPTGSSAAITLAGPAGFLWTQVGLHALIALYALYRLTRWAPVEAKGPHAPVPSGATPVLISLVPEEAADPDFPELRTSLHTGDLRLHVRERGGGEPVVLIHDVASSSRIWQHQLRGLARSGYHAFAYDLRGHGDSDPGRDYDLDAHVHDLREALASAVRDPAHLVGLGAGAAIALTYTEQHPEALRSLTLISPTRWIVSSRVTGRLEERIGVLLEPLLKTVGRHRAARRFARSAYDPRLHPDRYVLLADDAARARRRAVTATLRGTIHERRPDQDLPAPTLVVLGGRDRNSTPAMRRRLRRSLPSARLEVLPDAAHFVSLDDPHGLNTLLREHLARATAGAPPRRP